MTDLRAFPNAIPDQYEEEGLTKREYFAAAALTGLLAYSGIENIKDPTALAVRYADEIILDLIRS